MRFAVDYGINWAWFLAYELNTDGTITIHRHDRGHLDGNQGYYPPNWQSIQTGFRIVESPSYPVPCPADPSLTIDRSERVAMGVRLYDKGDCTEYLVANPKHVFAYTG